MKAYKNNENETRIAVLETIVSRIDQTLIRLENKMDKNHSDLIDKIDKFYTKLDTKIDTSYSLTRQEMNDLRKENTSQFRITIFTLLTLIGTPLLMESIKLLTKLIHGN